MDAIVALAAVIGALAVSVLALASAGVARRMAERRTSAVLQGSHNRAVVREAERQIQQVVREALRQQRRAGGGQGK